MKYYSVLAKMFIITFTVNKNVHWHSAFVIQAGFTYHEPLYAISPRTSKWSYIQKRFIYQGDLYNNK